GVDDLDVEDRHEGAERRADDGDPYFERARAGGGLLPGRSRERRRGGRLVAERAGGGGHGYELPWIRFSPLGDQLVRAALEHFPPKWAPVLRRKCDKRIESRAHSRPVAWEVIQSEWNAL